MSPLRAALIALLFCAARLAMAGDPPVLHIGLPSLEPQAPVAGEPIFVRFRTGPCVGIIDGPDDTDISLEGSTITFIVDGYLWNDPIFCMIPPTHHSFPLGDYPSGNYTLVAQLRYRSFSPNIATVTFGTIDFSVTGAPVVPQPVPSSDGYWLWLLIAGVMILAARRWLIRSGAPVILFAALSIGGDSPALAQSESSNRLHVLLSSDIDPAQVVEAWRDDVPLSKPDLSHGQPLLVTYLLPLRAEGDFKARLLLHPDTPRAKLERYVVIVYPDHTNLDDVMATLEEEPGIDAVGAPQPLSFSGASLTHFTVETSLGMADAGTQQYGWQALNIPAAWRWAGGHGLIGLVDSGLATQHPELRAFTPGGSFTRGNFLPVYSLDVGRWVGPPGQGGQDVDTNVDERQPEFVHGAPQCPRDPNGFASIDSVGHGTHVAGLAAANAYDDSGFAGTCKHCGIGMWRVVYALCVDPHGIFPATNYHATVAAITHSTDYGIEIVNQSFGGDWQDPDPCAVLQDKEPLCVALDYITTRDVVTVAASGNDRNWLNFPARDPRVVAAGGFQEGLQLWDDHPNCPNPQFDTECGSNYSYFAWNPKQEVVASARKVHGLTYPGFNWNTQYLCGDSFGPGPGNDGYGHCTGTSMSAPQVSGLFGILRSVNPLVLVGNPEQVLVQGVRNVLANTTVEAQASLPWGQHLGYGRPDAEAAVKRMLGKTAGVTVRNRATPLFAMYGPGSKDYAYTTSPQTAVALLLNQAANSSPSGAIVTGYPSFPPDPLLGPGDIPRADIFVMTTEYKTRASHPDLVPLYLFDRSRHFPVGCNPGSPSCNVHNRDYLLATGHAEVEALHAAGYSYRGLNGYVYQRCTPEPACIPEGAQKLWRKCKTADDDCALFLEGQRPGYESMGYTATLPAGYPQHIGYAYPNIDSDGDGLVDGFERLIGTSPTLFDTDGDGIGDGVEFPLASVSVADPCAGPLAWRCPADWLFANGFQP